MTENPRPRHKRSRVSESPELVARLQRSRQRTLQRRAAATEREMAITRAVGEYLTAWNAIATAEQRRDTDVERLREQIETVISRVAGEVATLEATQKLAAAEIRAQVHTDAEVADLLEITLKRTRQLLGGSRAQTPRRSKPTAPSNNATPARRPTTTAPVPSGPVTSRTAVRTTGTGSSRADRAAPRDSIDQRPPATAMAEETIASKRTAEGTTTVRITHADSDSPTPSPGDL